jgi:hypothetical protein
LRPGFIVLSILVWAGLAGCSGSEPGEPEPNPSELPVRPGSLVILAGEGQTDTAGATFDTPVDIEVRDSTGAPLSGAEVRYEEALVTGPFLDHGPLDTTDATGRVSLAWRPGGEAGPHRLRAGVYLQDAAHTLHLVVADTIVGTVTPASPFRVDFSGPASRFLGETLDMAGVVGPVWDIYSNAVTVTSVTVDAPGPFLANGTVVHSDIEADTAVNVVINGVPFGYRLEARRDLRELEGATGGWVCDKEPGAPSATQGLYIRRRDATVVVDSIHLDGSGDIWTFFYTAAWHDVLSDGTEADGEEPITRLVLDQSPGTWFWEYGPEMVQTGTAPLSYVAALPTECSSWDSQVGGTPAHEPLHLSK